MARVQLVDIDDMTGVQRAQYDRFPSNLTRGLLLLDPRLAAIPPELANALRASSLDAKVREGVILRVASLSQSAYEAMQHSEQVKTVGWTDTQIVAIKAGDYTGFPDDVVAILRFVDACVASPQISEATFDAVRLCLSIRDIATVILLAGHYMMIARFAAILDIELDAKPDAWTSEH